MAYFAVKRVYKTSHCFEGMSVITQVIKSVIKEAKS
jgi:hypothetical protein